MDVSSRMDSVIVTVCASFCWSWLLMVTMTSVLFAPFGCSDDLLSLHRLTFTGAFIIALIAGSIMLTNRTSNAIESRWLEIACSFFNIIGSIAIISGGIAHFDAVRILGSAILGVSCWSIVPWVHFFSRRGARSAFPMVAAPLALSFLIDLLVISLTPIAAMVFVCSIEIIVVLLIHLLRPFVHGNDTDKIPFVDSLRALRGIFYCNRFSEPIYDEDDEKLLSSKDNESEAQSSLKAHMKKLYPSCIACALVGISTGITRASTSYSLDIPALCVLSVAALLILASSAKIFMWSHNVIAAAYALGVAAYLLIDTSSNAMVVAICEKMLFLPHVGLYVTIWVVASDIAFTTRTDSIPLLALMILHAMLGMLVGLILPIPSALAANEAMRSVLQGYALAIAFFLISPALRKACRNATRRTTDAIDRANSAGITSIALPMHNHALEVADTFGLSPRECDVLELMMMGRSRKRISELMFISENTVGSHISHIYIKTGVHGFQELLDIVYGEEPALETERRSTESNPPKTN